LSIPVRLKQFGRAQIQRLMGGVPPVSVRSMQARFEYQGTLKDTRLPDILATIYHYRVPGVLTFKKDTAEKRVFINEGEVIFAASNVAQERLGLFFLRAGKITPQQYAETGRLIVETGKRHGTILVEQQLITPEELEIAVKAQVKHIVFSLFNWRRGEVTFLVGRFREDEVIKTSLRTADLIMDGVKQTYRKACVLETLGSGDVVLSLAKDFGNALRPLSLSKEEMALLRLVDGERPVKLICDRSQLRQIDTCKFFCGLLLLKVVHKRGTAARK